MSEEPETESGDETESETETDSDEGENLAAPKVTIGEKVLNHPRPSYLFLAISSIVFFIADAGSKWWVVHHVEPKPRAIDDGWHLRLSRVQNPGGAWGIFGDQPEYVRLPFFFIISAVAVVFVVSLYKKLEPRQVALKWALPLLLGGAAGNLLDRVRHQSVVDFLEFTIVKAGQETFRWPTFNVADIWIVAGVALMAIDMFTPRRPVPRVVQADTKA